MAMSVASIWELYKISDYLAHGQEALEALATLPLSPWKLVYTLHSSQTCCISSIVVQEAKCLNTCLEWMSKYNWSSPINIVIGVGT